MQILHIHAYKLKRYRWIIQRKLITMRNMQANKNMFEYQKVYMDKLYKIYELTAANSQKNDMATFQSLQEGMMNAGLKFWQSALQNPDHWMSAQKKYFESLKNQPPTNSSYAKYFKSDLWNDIPSAQWIKDVYIKTAEWIINIVDEETLGFKDDDRQKLKFITRQMIETMNPRNFPMTNPDVIQETINSNGENALRGMDNLIADMERGAISLTDGAAFTVGENIAVTPGNVIFQNKLMELIHYPSTAKETFAEPLVIIPPWINKFYILDLRPENSFIKWLTDQGHQVFCVSWANPDKSFADIDFKDYMHDGALKAIEIANKICKTKQANVIGYCIGGTLLAMTMAWLKQGKRTTPIQSATMLTTLLDFEHSGEIRNFIDQNQINAMKQTIQTNGYVDGKQIATSFALLRASDLIWSFIINNYMMGNKPEPFDLLYWNSDPTNLPATMAIDYLQHLYIDNALIKGEYVLDGHALDLETIDTPAYFLATQDDHIAPHVAVENGLKSYGGDVRYVLAGSGHIAGVINPPHKNKYGYSIGKNKYSGSWWNDWQKWITKSNKKMAFHEPNHYSDVGINMLYKAPGKYVTKKLDK